MTEAQCAAVALGAAAARIVFAPYRACLVGAHVDHQGGKITGFALRHGLAFGYTRTDERVVRVASADNRGEVAVTLDDPKFQLPPEAPTWGAFVRGACALAAPESGGLTGVVAGSLPAGGLSSSAALSLALLSACSEAGGACPDPGTLARNAMAIENRYVGVKCGLMDPTVIAHAREDHMVVLDCRSGEVSVEAGPEVALVAVYSGIKRALIATGFNSRTEECREAARQLAAAAGWSEPVTRLGDLPADLIDAHVEDIDAPLARRARHFRTECARVEEAVEAWRRRDLAAFGSCATRSCESSIANYESGTDELTALSRILIGTSGIHGARFAGGGYGGFCVGIADPERARAAADSALEEYRRLGSPNSKDAFAVMSRPSDGLRWLA